MLLTKLTFHDSNLVFYKSGQCIITLNHLELGMYSIAILSCELTIHIYDYVREEASIDITF